VTVVVTGGTGFIGSRVRSELEAAGHTVVAWSRRGTNGTESVDLSDLAAVTAALSHSEASALVHAAGSTPHNTEDAGIAWYATNDVVWAANLVEAARELGIERVIALGSAAEYGAAPAPQQVGNEEPPASPYGFGRRVCTGIFELARRQWGLDTSVLRVFSVYGPGQPRTMLVSTLVDAITEATPGQIGQLDRIRDFIHVSDVARAVRDAVETPGVPPVLNVGTGIGTSVGDLVRLLEAVGGRPAEVKVGMARPDDTFALVADLTLTFDAIRWRPVVGLADGLQSVLPQRPQRV